MNVPGILYIPCVALTTVKQKKELSTSRKAVRERNKRRDNTERKLFTEPLKLFLHHKYTAVYEEYLALYNEMKQKHPRSKDFTKTTTFKTWLNHHPKQDILTICMNEIDTGEQEQDNNAAAVNMNDEQSGEDNNAVAVNMNDEQSGEDNNAVAVNMNDERSGEDNNAVAAIMNDEQEQQQRQQQDLEDAVAVIMNDEQEQQQQRQQQDLEDFENVVNDIINDLQRDNDMYMYLNNNDNNVDDDEGICLEPTEEIEVEPFDFELEVEPFDF